MFSAKNNTTFLSCITDEFIYSAGLEIPYHKVSDNYYALITMKAMVLCKDDLNKTLPTIIRKFRRKKLEHFHYVFEIEKDYPELVQGKWSEIELNFITPYIRNSKDDLQVFGMLRGKGEFYLDNLSITSYVEK